MPKIVDIEERRGVIVDAVFRLIATGGVEAASLRNVAADAGLNVGSVRHYFTSHEALLLAATEAMAERVGIRMERHGARLRGAVASGDEAAIAAVVFALYAELLPLDEQRRLECAVWLAFSERARVRPELRPAGESIHRDVVGLSVDLLSGAGVPEVEERATLLATAVDGLTLAALSWPDDYPPARQERLLGRLLGWAFGEATPARCDSSA